MRKFLILVFISILMTGCSNDSSKGTTVTSVGTSQTPDATQPPVITQALPTKEPNETEHPIILTPSSTDQINYAVYSEGVFCIYNGEKYGFMKDNGNEITPYLYDYAYPFSEGLACVHLGDKFGFINNQGDTAISLEYDKAAPFSEGLAYFETGDKYGFIDKNGNVAFLLDCDSVSSFQEGLAYYSDGGKYGFIDETGKVVIKAVYDDAGYFQDGLAKVRVGLKLGVIDKNGTEIVPVDYDDISYDNGFIIVKSDNKYGCFDKNGNSIYKPVYDSISMLPGGEFAIVYLDNQPQIIDINGNAKISGKYDDILYYDNECGDTLIKIFLNNKIGYLNMSDFTEVIPPIYDWASFFINGHVVVGNSDKYGVIDKNGNTVIPINYEYIDIFNNGMLALDQGGKYILADSDGKIINNNQYDSIDEIGNYYIIETDGKYGFLDDSGAEVVKPVYDYIPIGEYNSIYHSKNTCVATSYGTENKDYIIEIDQDQDTDLSSLLLQNEITPKIKPFNQYQKSGSLDIPNSGEETITISIADGMNDCYKEFKLYDIDGSGIPVLYFYNESLIRQGPGILSYSGLYSVKNGLLNELATGSECGGTLGGYIVSFFKDTETSKILIGVGNYAGGFMGNAGGCDIYEYKNGEAKEIISYECINQIAGNYDNNTLINNAKLFYDENDKPYNKDTIVNADYVTEYRLGDKQVSIEDYNKFADRYETLPDFLRWLQ